MHSKVFYRVRTLLKHQAEHGLFLVCLSFQLNAASRLVVIWAAKRSLCWDVRGPPLHMQTSFGVQPRLQHRRACRALHSMPPAFCIHIPRESIRFFFFPLFLLQFPLDKLPLLPTSQCLHPPSAHERTLSNTLQADFKEKYFFVLR